MAKGIFDMGRYDRQYFILRHNYYPYSGGIRGNELNDNPAYITNTSKQGFLLTGASMI